MFHVKCKLTKRIKNQRVELMCVCVRGAWNCASMPICCILIKASWNFFEKLFTFNAKWFLRVFPFSDSFSRSACVCVCLSISLRVCFCMRLIILVRGVWWRKVANCVMQRLLYLSAKEKVCVMQYTYNFFPPVLSLFCCFLLGMWFCAVDCINVHVCAYLKW